MDRINLVGYLFPYYDRYASQGYGFKIHVDSDNDFNDETSKNIYGKFITRHWLIRVNHQARCLCEYIFRPETWNEYVNIIIQTRSKIVTALSALQVGVLKYLGSNKGVNIVKKHLDLSEWDDVKSELDQLPRLPQSTVDQWGFVSETSRSTIQSPTEALGILGITPENHSRYIPNSIMFQQYQEFLDAERGYLRSMKNFFDQATHVLILTSGIKRNSLDDVQQKSLENQAKELNVRMDLEHSSTRVFWDATKILDEYQLQFRKLLEPFVEEENLSDLEKKERELVFNNWVYWYFLVSKRNQAYSNPRKRLLKRIEHGKLAIDRQIDSALLSFNNEKWEAKRCDAELKFENQTVMWFRLEIKNPVDYYLALQGIYQSLHEEFGDRDKRSFEDYLLELHYRHVIVIPTFEGKLINRFFYAPRFEAALHKSNLLETNTFAHSIITITDSQLSSLSLEVWDNHDIEMANELANDLHKIRLIASRLNEFNSLPENGLTPAGFNQLQEYLNELSGDLSETIDSFVARKNQLAESLSQVKIRPDDLEMQELIDSCFIAFLEIQEIVFPSKNNELSISLPEMRNYLSQLNEIADAIEGLRLSIVGIFLKP